MIEYLKPVYSDELRHYQVKGAKWGVRRWQNLDGSLTPEGRIHYGIGPARDKDPDLDHPIEKAKADVLRVSASYDRWKSASDDVKRYAKESNARRKLFEKKSDYNERINTAKMRLDIAEVEEIDSSNEYDDARKAAQTRFEKYMKIADELESDVDWIDQHMYLETGEAGSKQTYKDREEMESMWAELQEAVDVYWYDGLMNHDRASNANAEYRDQYEMNDSPRGKEAAKEQTVKFALRNVKLPKTGQEAYDSIAKDIAKGKLLDSNEILKNIDVTPLSTNYKLAGNDYTDRGRELRAEADLMADRIAEKILGEYATQHYPDPKQPNKHAIEFVAGYLQEKAYAESTDDIGDLMSAWESFDYYDVTDKLNRELKKQQHKQS